MNEIPIVGTGSREWTDRDVIRTALLRVADGQAIALNVGDAGGADRIMLEEADELDIAVRVFPARWNRDGKRAGIIRNLRMLDVAQPSVVLAFRNGDTPGTHHMIDAALARGIRTYIYDAGLLECRSS
jgi:hypothetical protein